jgi:hypothetical protein
MNGISIIIGHYIVTEPEKVSRCPSYYAADHETLELQPGRYPITLLFATGYTCPMPYYLQATIDSKRVSGALYSGFGGVNFAKTELEIGEHVPYHYQSYNYELKNLLDAGRVELLATRADLARRLCVNEDAKVRIDEAKKLSWDEIRMMRKDDQITEAAAAGGEVVS